MGCARVVAFDGVDGKRMEEMKQQMRDGGRPDDVPATEILVLHDPGAEQSLVVLFFDSDEDYAKADVALEAMSAGDTPGHRTSVRKFDVAARMTA